MTAPPSTTSTNRSPAMDDADEAARRIVEHDPYFPKNDEWNDDLTFDARIVARAYLDLRARMARDGWIPVPAETPGSFPFNGARVIVGWSAEKGMSEHVELGRWKSGTGRDSGWRNTYGRPFEGKPDYYRPFPAPPAKDQT